MGKTTWKSTINRSTVMAKWREIKTKIKKRPVPVSNFYLRCQWKITSRCWRLYARSTDCLLSNDSGWMKHQDIVRRNGRRKWIKTRRKETNPQGNDSAEFSLVFFFLPSSHSIYILYINIFIYLFTFAGLFEYDTCRSWLSIVLITLHLPWVFERGKAQQEGNWRKASGMLLRARTQQQQHF